MWRYQAREDPARQVDGQPKGRAYIEFSDQDSKDNALLLHNSEFRGRMLTVTEKQRTFVGTGVGAAGGAAEGVGVGVAGTVGEGAAEGAGAAGTAGGDVATTTRT